MLCLVLSCMLLLTSKIKNFYYVLCVWMCARLPVHTCVESRCWHQLPSSTAVVFFWESLSLNPELTILRIPASLWAFDEHLSLASSTGLQTDTAKPRFYMVQGIQTQFLTHAQQALSTLCHLSSPLTMSFSGLIFNFFLRMDIFHCIA